MKKLKWIVLSLVVLVTVGGVVGALALKSWLGNVLTRESFVRQLETQWNCRADMASLNVSLSSNPARVEINNLVLAPRDADAAAGAPLASRKPIAEGAILAGADHLLLEVNLNDLIHQRLHIQRITLSSLHLRNDVSAEKGNLLADLFKRPQSPAPVVTAPPRPAIVAAVADATPTSNSPPAAPATEASPSPTDAPLPPSTPAGAATDKTEKAKPHHGVFQAAALGLSVVIDEALIEQGSFHEINHLVRNRTDITDLGLKITQVDIDPMDLAHHNQCTVSLAAHIVSNGRAKVGDANQTVKISDFTFQTGGTLQPLAPESGEFSPVGTLDLLVKKGSVFGGTMTLAELAGKDKGLESAKKNFGIDVSNLIVGGALQDDMHTLVAFAGPRIEFTNDARLLFPDYAVTLRAGSWLNGSEDKTEMQLQLIPGDPLAKTILAGVSAKLGEGLVKLALEVFNDGQGHLAFDLVATEHLSKPKIKIGGQAGVLQKAFEGLGGGLLKGLVK